MAIENDYLTNAPAILSLCLTNRASSVFAGNKFDFQIFVLSLLGLLCVSCIREKV